MLADREGRLKDNPRQIKMEIFPCDDVDVNALLEELMDARHIIRYEVDGMRIIQIRKFKEHQNPHKNESPSTLPEQTLPLHPLREHSSNYASTPADSLIPDSCISDSLIPDSKASCSEPSGQSEPAAEVIRIPTNRTGEEFAVTEAHVSEFNQAYPSVDVQQVLREIRAWNVSNPTRRKTANGMLKHINSWLAREQNRGGNGHTPRARSPDKPMVSDVTEHNMAALHQLRKMEGRE